MYKKRAGRSSGASRASREPGTLPFIVALLSHLTRTGANLLSAFPEIEPEGTKQVSEETLNRIFQTPITKIDGRSGFVIFNVNNYSPISVKGTETGHIFMVVKDLDTRELGTIGFYPENYRRTFGIISSVFGDTGVLVTPDPIAKKYSKLSQFNENDFQLIHYSNWPMGSSAPKALDILNKTLSQKPLESQKKTSSYSTNKTYQPLKMRGGENCYTYINNTLGIKLGSPSSSAIPNVAFNEGDGVGGLYGMVSGAASSVSDMFGLSARLPRVKGMSRKKRRHKSKNKRNKRNNIKKTRRRRRV